MKVTINKDGQIRLPWIIRACLDAQAGDEFDIELTAVGRCKIKKLTPPRWDKLCPPSSMTHAAADGHAAVDPGEKV